MPNKSKPSRRKIKKAIVHMADLTGLPMSVWRKTFKQEAALRNIDSLMKANTFYPVSIEQTPRDLTEPIEFKFEYTYAGKLFHPKPTVEIPTPYRSMSDSEAEEFTEKLREVFTGKQPSSLDADPSEEVKGAEHQSIASTIAELKKMRIDMLAPLPEPISPLKVEQMKRMMQSIKRIVDESPKFVIVTTPSKVNENSFFDQVGRGEAQPTLTWTDADVTLQMSDHLEEEAKKLLTVRRGKMRGEHLVKADPTILYNIPLSLKDLSDEHPGTTEPPPGTDPVPGDTEPGT